MREVAVRGKDEEGIEGRPDEAARKRVAVELIRTHDRPLRWTARRYSICAEDAEDAYQRGIEILLSKAPTVDLRQLLSWARTVIKHEALAIRKTRERTLTRPSRSDDDHADEDWVDLIPATGDGPDELTVRRERVARSREALSQLKPAELKALTQLAEGFSYQEIGAMNDWTRTKVNRCLSEGRARFRDAFRASEAGERCPEFEPLLSACCDGELSRAQLATLEKHLAACGHCRSTLRAYRAAPKAAAALAPAIPAGHGLWEKVQELFVSAQMRIQGVGGGSDSAVQGVLASGGTRGTGMAAIAKLAAICAGTAGTAAACAATGVIPTTDLLPRGSDQQAIERRDTERDREPPRTPMVFVEPAPQVISEQPVQNETPNAQPEPQTQEPVEQEPVVTTQAPTATETEFTPEAAGTPAPAATPPPPASTSSSVPIGNGGGEFAP